MAQSSTDSGWIYQCDDIIVEPRAHRLERAGVELSVEPKAYAVLVALLQQPGEVVGKDTLLDAAWGHRHVTPGVLTRVISQLRHALGDSAGHPRYIATVHTLGYRFIGEVQKTEIPETAPVRAAIEVPVERAETPAASLPQRASPGLRWIAAVITVAVIVAMLAMTSLEHPPHATSAAPGTSPQPALAVMPVPFAHSALPHATHMRHAPRYRRLAHFMPSTDQEPEPGGSYLSARPEQTPAARQ